MKIKANIKVMNDVTFPHSVVIEADTKTGGLEIRVLDKIVELNRVELVEFLDRTIPLKPCSTSQ